MSQTDEPPVEEDEENKSSTRRAFFAGVNKADTFTGAFRGVPSPRHGGSQYVKDTDAPLGDEEHCWCGRPLGHDWPGKAGGAKHPREDSGMSAMSDEKPYLNPRDLASWDRRVVQALCALVNEYGVRYRLDRNRMHVYLWAPGQPIEGVITRFKAGRSRSAEQQLAMIEKWAETYVRPILTEDKVRALAEKVNDPTKTPRKKAAPAPAKAATAPPAAPAPEAPEIETSQASEAKGDQPPAGWERYYGAKRRSIEQELNWWKRIGADLWMCKTCDFTATDPMRLGGHQRVHTVPMEVKQAATQAMNDVDLSERSGRAGKTRQIRRVYEILEEATGVSPQRGRDQATKIARLEAALAKVTQQRDELQARYDLIREAMRA